MVLIRNVFRILRILSILLNSDLDTQSLNFQSRTSTKCPAIAAAAAIIGETRCVRPPRPWRPSKLRLLVDAHRSPSCRMSSFIARHIEQPASRHSKPASVNILARPSSSACFLICIEPGTTIAFTRPATRYPLATLAASRRSSIREFVHDPINPRSIDIWSIRWEGSTHIYWYIRSNERASLSSRASLRSGTDSVTFTDISGDVPHVTNGSKVAASISTVLS